jgi:hypothetical protein
VICDSTVNLARGLEGVAATVVSGGMLRVDLDRFGVIHDRLVDFPLCAMRQASMIEGVGIARGNLDRLSDLFEAQREAMDSFIKRQRMIGHVQELPEIIATDRARRRAERAEELRDLSNRHEIAETRRMTERAIVERDLVDAQQALTAQWDHGYSSYELEWKKRTCEMLDVELSAAERRAILRQHLAELDQSEPNGAGRASAGSADAALDDTLYEVRAQLLANGLDPSGIDALIQRRIAKP